MLGGMGVLVLPISASSTLISYYKLKFQSRLQKQVKPSKHKVHFAVMQFNWMQLPPLKHLYPAPPTTSARTLRPPASHVPRLSLFSVCSCPDFQIGCLSIPCIAQADYLRQTVRKRHEQACTGRGLRRSALAVDVQHAVPATVM